MFRLLPPAGRGSRFPNQDVRIALTRRQQVLTQCAHRGGAWDASARACLTALSRRAERSSARVDAYASLTRSVCQLVCQETAGGRDSGQIVKDSGEPKVRQLEPRR